LRRGRYAGLTLALLVLGVLADHAHDAFAADDLAVLTDTFDAGSDFHGRFSLLAAASSLRVF
jgi:hypothetical protein